MRICIRSAGMLIHRISDDNIEIRLLVGRLTYIADDLGLRDAEVCSILRMPPGAWPVSSSRAWVWRPESWTEQRLRRLVETLEMTAAFRVEDAAAWLRTPNSQLYGRRPIDLLIEDREGLLVLRDRLREEDDR